MLIATVTHPVPAPPRVARADGKTGRFYTITDPETGASVKYPSVTTILGVISKPALVPWAAREERLATSEAAAELYTELHGKQQLPRSMYLLALEQRLGKTKAHAKQLAKAAEIGSAVHARIEWGLKRLLGQRVGAEPVLEDAALWAFMAYEDWAKAVQLRPRFIEQTVYSRQHQYAGTMDLLADLNAAALLGVLERQGAVDRDLAAWLTARSTVTALIDFKSSKAIYGESFLQSAAYQKALIEMGHGRPDGGLIVRLPKVTTDPGFEVAVVPNARQLMPAFLAARELFNWTFQQELEYQRRTGP
jgi:hypothetical protein